MARPRIDPTLAGSFSILVWGCAIPIAKSVEDRIGLVAFLGFAFTAMAVFGVLRHLLLREPLPDRRIFRDWRLYARWFCFVLHEGFLAASLALVQRRHMPFVILLNYLWPTAIILCSIFLAAVSVTRWWSVILGSLLVLSSIGFEVLGPHPATTGLFARKADCLAYLLVFVGAISWGLYSALSRRFGPQTGGASVLPLFQATLGTALVFSLLPGSTAWSHFTLRAAVLLAGYCFLLFVAYLTWDTGMRFGNVVLLSLFADLIPWLSLLTTSLMLHVSIPPQAAIAAVVLVAGAIITRTGTTQRQPPDVLDEPVF
jgi:drug/metabolite transporter (DMT)-like permease